MTPKKINSTGLTIQPNESEALTKEQNIFNMLLDRMRKAEIKIEEERKLLDQLLSDCITKVYPLHQETIRLDLQVIVELFTYYSSNSFSAIRKIVFIDFMNEMIDAILFSPHGLNAEETKKLNEIHDTINKIESKKKSKKATDLTPEEEFAISMMALEQDLHDRGYMVDLSGVTIDMSIVEINRYIEKKMSEFNENKRNNNSAKKETKKTKKQLEKEKREQEVEELKGKSLSSIYKSLVKILHPDLEQNPEKKIQKEHWMKMLTVAYEKKDLKTLLEIELEWAKGESNNIQSIAKEKLILYNEMLQSQAQEMEIQAATVCTENKYELLTYFAGGPFNVKRWRPAFSIKRLDQKKINSEIILEILEKQDEKTKKLVDRVLKDHKRSIEY